MSIIDPYACVNYFMPAVLVDHFSLPNMIADLGLYIGITCASYIYWCKLYLKKKSI